MQIKDSYEEARQYIAQLPKPLREKLFSKRRSADMVKIRRQVAQHLYVDYGLSTPRIAELMGNLQHSTILNYLGRR